VGDPCGCKNYQALPQVYRFMYISPAQERQFMFTNDKAHLRK